MFVKIKLMHDEISGFLKQVASFIRLTFESFTNAFIEELSIHELKSNKILFPHFDDWTSLDMDKQFRCNSILLLLGL